MADFCKECSIRVFGEDFGDFANPAKDEFTITQVLCEGCGFIWVNKFGEKVQAPDDDVFCEE